MVRVQLQPYGCRREYIHLTPHHNVRRASSPDDLTPTTLARAVRMPSPRPTPTPTTHYAIFHTSHQTPCHPLGVSVCPSPWSMSFNLRAPQSIPTMSRSPYAPSFRRNRQLPSPLSSPLSYLPRRRPRPTSNPTSRPSRCRLTSLSRWVITSGLSSS